MFWTAVECCLPRTSQLTPQTVRDTREGRRKASPSAATLYTTPVSPSERGAPTSSAASRFFAAFSTTFINRLRGFADAKSLVRVD